MRFGVLLFDGVEELDFVGPYEVLCAAANLGANLEVRLAALETGETIECFNGMRVVDYEPLEETSRFDVMVVPGGAWLSGEDTGVRRAVRDGRIPEMLALQHANGALLASVCTGAFLLGAAGLLRGRRAVTHHAAKADLARFGAEPAAGRVVEDGRIITGGGVTAGIDVALFLLRRTFGGELEEKVRDYLEYPASQSGGPAA